jgi:hypothetical protein
MPKFSFKRPRIISKKFPEVDSTIDSVTKSLDELVFSYSEHVDKTLQKKHVMMALSSLTLILVLGSFISPKGKAESSVFYPETCLGGWVNPQYAQGEIETTSNGDESQFTKHNSAVLPANTEAEMYCGNFKGKFDETTKPTKIVVSLALTKGIDLLLEDTIESGLVPATSTLEIGSTTVATSTLIDAATTTEDVDTATSSVAVGASTSDIPTVATSTEVATSTDPNAVGTAEARVPSPIDDTTSAVESVIDSLKEGIINLFENNKDATPVTDTVVVPPPPQDPPASPAPVVDPPTSILPWLKEHFVSVFVQSVFAEEVDQSSVNAGTVVTEPIVVTPTSTTSADIETSSGIFQNAVQEEASDSTTGSSSLSSESPEVIQTSTSSNDTVVDLPATENSTSSLGVLETVDLSGATGTMATGTVFSSTTESLLATTTLATEENDNQFQNNFLEVLYTFDGVTWLSLGELNEISMKYRTFEIPVTASTSWSDMSHLQVKIVAKRHDKVTPTVYLDGIKVEVLYETVLTHSHPDFARDTILKDEILDGVRVVTIINSETKSEEIWYMYLDDEEVSNASSTVLLTEANQIASSTVESSSTQPTLDAASTTVVISSTTDAVATTSLEVPQILNLLKNKWKKYEGKNATLGTAELVLDIKKLDVVAEEEALDMLPDFASDTIKKIKGLTLQSVIVQIERNLGTDQGTRDELWMYNAESGTEEQVGGVASSTVAADSPLAIKDGYLFWISMDKTTVYAFNMTDKSLKSHEIPSFDTTKGERAEVVFDGVPWKVIIGADGFSFFSDETGEVFSDDNGSVIEMLRRKLKLDSVLDIETLSNLNLQVDAATTSQQ